ncbi:MAG: 30S ribosomal protein S21 [Candidatus Saccharimonadales bacterium]
MTQVTRKDDREPVENMIRRFNRKVHQWGGISEARSRQYFEKAPSKRERRESAIRKHERREEKMRRIMLGKQ